ncbi:MAG: hydrogenase maturation protease [Armatimonadetes bacterium]|nr:hydrogenase maturation protease [Armatimonadota bacterium]
MPEGAPARVVVLGVGSELYTDDGVGVAVARELAGDALPPPVEVVEGHVGGLDLLFDMEGADHVIIVDAVAMGRAPGEVAVFTPAEVKMLPPGTICSLHHIGLEQVLEFAGLMGFDARLHVVGIQPESVSPGLGLSATAAAAVPVAIARVRQLLREDGLALAE